MDWDDHPRYFTEEHKSFRLDLRKFVESEITPQVDRIEQSGHLDRDILKRMAREGFLGVQFPKKHGGGGKDFWHTVVFCEEFSG